MWTGNRFAWPAPQPQSLHRGKEDWKCPLHKIDYQINMRAQEEMHYAPQKQG